NRCRIATARLYARPCAALIVFFVVRSVEWRDVRPVAREAEPPIPGVIDTLTDGFQLVNRAPVLLLVPVLLDLLLWLGPKLSVADLAERAPGRLVPPVEQLGQEAGPAATDQLDQLNQQVALLREAVRAFNLLSLLAFQGGWTIHTAVPPDRGGTAGVIEVSTV